MNRFHLIVSSNLRQCRLRLQLRDVLVGRVQLLLQARHLASVFGVRQRRLDAGVRAMTSAARTQALQAESLQGAGQALDAAGRGWRRQIGIKYWY